MAGVEPSLARVGPLMHKALCCLRCGGFAGFRSESSKGAIGYGRAVSRLVNLEHAEILGYFSRTLEEFGSSKLTRYLLRDSLACTLAQKHKLNSRAAAYRVLGPSLQELPTPSFNRPRRFHPSRAAPTWPCSYSNGCPIGHGTPSLPMFESLSAAEMYDKRMWKEADGLLAERRVAKHGGRVVALIEAAKNLPATELRSILARRVKARGAGEFDEADVIRAELAEFGVHVNDKTNRWHSADGRSGTIEPFAIQGRGWQRSMRGDIEACSTLASSAAKAAPGGI